MILDLEDGNLFRNDAYVNGKWIKGANLDRISVKNPANGEEIASVANLSVEEAANALKGASLAWANWRNRTAAERADILFNWYNLIRAAREDLALILTLEQGKPFAEALGEIDYGASYIRWFAEEARRIYGTIIPGHRQNVSLTSRKEPIGVVAAITPWNFPNAMITRKVAPALAAGCPVVLKPASATPLSALALAELADRAGIPSGVFSVVPSNSSSAIGQLFATSSIVRKITFTGSTEVGRILLQQAAGTIKKCSMELGGNAPVLVFDDADIPTAVSGVIAAKFRNTGQTCVCANRIYVADSIYDDFCAQLVHAVKNLEVGEGMAKGVSVGPLIDAKALQKVEALLADAVKGGAICSIGGQRLNKTGNFFQPTVLREVSNDMSVVREEIFGPVAPLVRFHTEAEAIAMANDSIHGLASYVFASDPSRIERVTNDLEAGMVGINTGAISTEVAPFGGVKQSGLGREGAQLGIEDYLETKYVCQQF